MTNRDYLLTHSSIILVIAFASLFVSISSCSSSEIPPPNNLSVSEGFSDPIGFYDADPTFSWLLPVAKGVENQSAYEIEVYAGADQKKLLWGSGKVLEATSNAVPYGLADDATTLGKSRRQVNWRVRYWDQDDRSSDWSPTATVEYGLLNNDDWAGKWIGLPPPTDTTEFGLPRFRPVYLRKSFSLDELPEQARLYLTAKGLFTAYLNGKRIGKDVMTPGWTPYKKRIETLTYDVTDLLQTGENILGVTLTEGWYAGRIGYSSSQWTNREPPRLLLQLETGDTRVVSNESWRASDQGPLRYASIYDGASYQPQAEFADWKQPGFATSDWSKVAVDPIEALPLLRPKRHAPTAIMDTLLTQSVSEIGPSRALFDLGQNMVGVPHLQVPLKRGDTLQVRMAEMLNQDGSLHLKSYRSARSLDYFVAERDGSINWHPSFTFHGFRYIELSGYPAGEKPKTNWVKGLVQHSNFSTTGTFTSDHSKLNQLQSNIEWGLRGNFLDIPTDCPQRDERMGWTGDAQVFAPTSLFLRDVHAFWAAWLQSMREEQLPDGGIPIVIPNIAGKRFSAGWGDAATIIPWELYQRTGDQDVLEENYPMMRDWVDFYRQQANDQLLVNFQSFNDWLQPYPTDGNLRGDTPQEFICTAFFARSIDLCGRSARVLGKDQEAKALEALLDSVKTALQTTYFAPDGSITEERGTQTAYLLALGFDLLPAELAERAVTHLLAQIEAADYHLRTGFLGTPLLAPVLDRYGHTDLAYRLLFTESYPSWFYSIDQGATTMWERWNSYSHENGFETAGMNSFNHYAYGAIGQWMYERVAGIAHLEPGYRKIEFAPIPGGPLKQAAATHESPYGHIASSWTLTDDTFKHTITVPPNTTGQIVVPPAYRTWNIQLFQSSPAGTETVLALDEDRATGITVTAGTYRLVATNAK
ncbi:MAG: family 78 glycoside hydrolase catalytic domain [Bacteroidota bacterium]